LLLSQALLNAPPLIALVESLSRPLLSTVMITVGLSEAITRSAAAGLTYGRDDITQC
jgi:hypothetical protein